MPDGVRLLEGVPDAVVLAVAVIDAVALRDGVLLRVLVGVYGGLLTTKLLGVPKGVATPEGITVRVAVARAVVEADAVDEPDGDATTAGVRVGEYWIELPVHTSAFLPAVHPLRLQSTVQV